MPREIKSLQPCPALPEFVSDSVKLPSLPMEPLKSSVPRPGQSLEERLTLEDEIWLAKMNISLVGTSRRNARRVASAEVGNG